MSNRLIHEVRESFIRATNGKFLDLPADTQDEMIVNVINRLPSETREYFR